MFSDRLTKIRKDNGLSQGDIAALLNVTQAAVSKYECGKADPSIETLVLLSKCFDVSVDWLTCADEVYRHPIDPVDRVQAIYDSLLPDERKLLERFRACDDDGREMILSTALSEKRRSEADESQAARVNA